MTREQYPAYRGWTVRCSAPDCGQETAEQAPSRTWQTEDIAVLAAKSLGWLHAPDETGRQQWFCPLHQAWEAATRRWVAAPAGRTSVPPGRVQP